MSLNSVYHITLQEEESISIDRTIQKYIFISWYKHLLTLRPGSTHATFHRNILQRCTTRTLLHACMNTVATCCKILDGTSGIRLEIGQILFWWRKLFLILWEEQEWGRLTACRTLFKGPTFSWFIGLNNFLNSMLSLPSPVRFGWKLKKDHPLTVLMIKRSGPDGITEVTTCGSGSKLQCLWNCSHRISFL